MAKRDRGLGPATESEKTRSKRRKEEVYSDVDVEMDYEPIVEGEEEAEEVDVQAKGMELWQTVKDAVKDGRPLALNFVKKPNPRVYGDYYQIIKNPIALDDIKKKLKSGAYPDLDAVRRDFELCFTNAKTYNLPESLIYADAKDLLKLTNKTYRKLMPEHGKPPSMKRLLNSRLQKVIKRTDDSGRFLATEFMELPSRKLWPGYYIQIQQPRCLETIQKQVKRKEYASSADFAADVELVFANAMDFNQEHTQIWEDALALRDYFRALMADLPPEYALPQYSQQPSTSKPINKIRIKVPVPTHTKAEEDDYDVESEEESLPQQTLPTLSLRVPAPVKAEPAAAETAAAPVPSKPLPPPPVDDKINSLPTAPYQASKAKAKSTVPAPVPPHITTPTTAPAQFSTLAPSTAPPPLAPGALALAAPAPVRAQPARGAAAKSKQVQATTAASTTSSTPQPFLQLRPPTRDSFVGKFAVGSTSPAPTQLNTQPNPYANAYGAQGAVNGANGTAARAPVGAAGVYATSTYAPAPIQPTSAYSLAPTYARPTHTPLPAPAPVVAAQASQSAQVTQHPPSPVPVIPAGHHLRSVLLQVLPTSSLGALGGLNGAANGNGVGHGVGRTARGRVVILDHRDGVTSFAMRLGKGEGRLVIRDVRFIDPELHAYAHAAGESSDEDEGDVHEAPVENGQDVEPPVKKKRGRGRPPKVPKGVRTPATPTATAAVATIKQKKKVNGVEGKKSGAIEVKLNGVVMKRESEEDEQKKEATEDKKKDAEDADVNVIDDDNGKTADYGTDKENLNGDVDMDAVDADTSTEMKVDEDLDDTPTKNTTRKQRSLSPRWIADLKIGRNILEVGEKGGMVWKVYAERIG